MMRNEILRPFIFAAVLSAIIVATFGGALAGSPAKQDQKSGEVMLTDAEIENLVKRSYQYVAMYNVNNKFAIKQGGWNTVDADTKLKDHTMREIARPNNDTLYIPPDQSAEGSGDSGDASLRFGLVSLMVTGYDHYVNVPMATRLGDFKKPEKILFYTERTEGYDGKPVEGVDRVFECTGDFISAVLRIMPHAKDQERFQRITEQMEQVKITTLSEFRGGEGRNRSTISSSRQSASVTRTSLKTTCSK